ncbi:MAG: alpha/beta hydrolase family protein [Nocardioidaceae bacterium]
MVSRTRGLAALLTLLLLVSACSSAASAPLADTTRLGAHNDTSTPFNLVSVPALTRQRYDGHGLRRTAVLQRTDAFTRYAVRYVGAGLRITGIMDVPTSPGRHPVVVIAHGYVPPSSYRTGDTLVHEQAYLARRGFVAFQIDYRNYGGSTRESDAFVAHPRGYPEDLVNAVVALRKARLPFVDPHRVVYFGRSMGGGVVLDALVARPHLVDAAVLYSPVSSRAADDFHRWVEPGTELRRRVVADYGTPRSRPRVWRQASSRTYLGRVAVPVLVNHGTADPVCPPRWSRATVRALRRDGKDARLLTYPGQQHRFGPRATALLMRRTVEFYRAHLDAPVQASTK